MTEAVPSESVPLVDKENAVDSATDETPNHVEIERKTADIEPKHKVPEGTEGAKTAGEDAVKGDRSDGEGADSPQSDGVKVPDQQDEGDDESEDEGIDGNEDMLDKSSRDAIYEKGMQYEAKKKNRLALKCYLQCLKGLGGGTEFSYLPQCLRKVADLYFKQDELEKAIQFIQAEKMYYETALIDTSQLQLKVEERKKSQEQSPAVNQDPNFTNPDIVRADEFENLARMCLEKDQAQLALEYQGKATKLRQKIYGDVHEVTKKSLDFFTVIYGEVGKMQYSESMQKLSQPAPAEGQEESTAKETIEDGSGSPQSILRKRTKESSQKKGQLRKRVSFVEPHVAREKREQEEWISKAILWVLFFFCSFLLVVIFHYIYCKLDIQSNYCSTMKADFHYYYMRFKYLVYYYTTPSTDDTNIG